MIDRKVKRTYFFCI